MRAVAIHLTLLFSALPAFGDVTVKTSVAIDIVGEYANNKESKASDETGLRAAEVSLFANLNHNTTGKISFTAHATEHEAAHVMMHEAFVDHRDFLPDSRIRLGQFALGFGALNSTHQHERLFIDSPFYHKKFFSDEGVMDTGLEYIYGSLSDDLFEAHVGVANGYTFGHSHDHGEKPRQPTHYARLATKLPFVSGGENHLALNVVRRLDAMGDEYRYYGADFEFDWYRGNYTVFLVQSEWWMRDMKPESGDRKREFGGYLFPEYSLSEQLSFGLRLDYFTNLSLENANGKKLKNAVSAIVPSVGYSPQEEIMLRVAFRHQTDEQDMQDTVTDQAWLFQAAYVFGDHIH